MYKDKNNKFKNKLVKAFCNMDQDAYWENLLLFLSLYIKSGYPD